jgi:hypothetical protein
MGGNTGYQIQGTNDYSILGDDDLARILSGEDAGEPVDMQAVRQEAAVRAAARNAVMVKHNEPTTARVFPMGFESPAVIPSGDSVLIIARPQVIFRPEYLRVPSDIAGDFAIDDIKVGKDSQFVAPGPIPARLLQENAIGSRMQMDTAQISQEITVAVTNRSGADRVFAAGMWGNAVE